MAGMSGCVASVDATHIVHEKCTYRLNRLHKGGKSKQTTQTFNLSANHRRCILATTKGHPGSYNDKTLVLFDLFLSDVKHGRIFEDNGFELLEERHGNVIRVKYRGVWFIVDNGYLSWAITVPPFIHTQSQKEIRWSEWLESMRKDVECTFGILKGRWRILKSGIRLHGTDTVDCIWLTCCALHNMLLEVDGLDQPWDGVIAPTSTWEGELGDLNTEDVPLALRRLLSPAVVRNYDTSSMGLATCSQEDSALENIINETNEQLDTPVRQVHLLSMPFFRSRLVDHFDILWRRGQLVWPRSCGRQSSTLA
eukprot:CCRYP_020668-RA/>CCRYP_020668-RA protein AED:0.19 eAED:0.16 QI:0/-1/0/1/-1/1/1/0/308